MKINNSNQVKGVAFQGYQHKKTETGAQAYHFNATFDSNKYNCEIQFFNVGVDKKGNFFVEKGMNGSIEPFYTADVPKEGVVVEPEYDLDLEKRQPFAYRMVLTEKNNPNKKVYLREDSSTHDGFTIVTRTGSTVMQQGPMYLAVPDTYAAGYVYAGFKDVNTGEIIKPDAKKKKEISDKIRSTNRGFATVIGGTMAGLEAKIPELAEAGNKRLITTPLQGGATVAADKYWPENNFLTARGLGNKDNLDSLQRTAFRYGMNTVDDGTFTSEGLQGNLFQRAIKWMDNEQIPDEFYMFRMNGLKDGALGFGVVPENYENMSCKIVNCKFDFIRNKDGQYDIVKNKDYDPEKPTYLQIFDDSLVSDAQRKDKKNIITAYDKTTPDGNKLAINTHDDTVQPYSFEVNNEEIRKNIINLNEVNKKRYENDRIKIDSPKGAMFVGSLSGISISPKVEGGFVCWNAYTDLAKYNYFSSNYDNELLSDIKDPAERALEMKKLQRANYQLRDMACSVARYRTANVRKNITEYTAKTIGEISDDPTKAYQRITSIIDSQNPKNPKLPADLRPKRDVVANVLEDNYEMRPKYEKYEDALNASIMELPLSSIEFAPDVQGALASPFLSKLSSDEEHIGQTRFEAMKDDSYKVPQRYAKTYNKMNAVFTKDIGDFADKVLHNVNAKSGEKLFDSDGEMTEFGKYVIPMVGQDIARYAVTKALMPSAKIKMVKGGKITYDYDDLTARGTLAHMGINGDSQADEANQIVNKMHKGVKSLDWDDVEFVAKSIGKRFNNTNANSLKLAEVMIDRSGYGLDWRFDAAKDVSDIDSMENGDQSVEAVKKDNVKFWGDMVKTITSENPNSYTVAEITDMKDGFVDAMINLAGITSEANYSYFFDGISQMFGYEYTDGSDKVGNDDFKRVEKLEKVLNGFSEKPIDYKRNSYTFATNHDKPRMIHCLSMDMSLFHSNLNNKDDKDHRKRAYMIMNSKEEGDLSGEDWNVINNDNDYFRNASSKAIANGELLRENIKKVNSDIHYSECEKIKNNGKSAKEKQSEYNEADKKYNTLYSLMSRAVADVVNGNYYKNNSKGAIDKKVPDSYKKVLEKDGFGTKPVPDAFDIIYNQAVYLNSKAGDEEKIEMPEGEELIAYKNMVDSRATEVGRTKTRIIMRYLNAIAGNPTLYAGDEYGMTGFEDFKGNTYLQNRNPLDHLQTEVIEGENKENINEYYRQDIADYKQSLYDLSRARKGDERNLMEAMNNGTMYKLNQMRGTNGNLCSAVMYQAANGAMNISVFNPNGVSTDPKINLKDLHPTPMSLESISLSGPKGIISLTPGTEFRNANSKDKAIYRVHEYDGNYFIKNDESGDGNIQLNEETAPDGVMVLYHVPENVEMERADLVKEKSKNREYYNRVHNIPQSEGYISSNKPEEENGKNIDITSK